MPPLAVTPGACGLPGCPEPRLTVRNLCPCEEDECPARHIPSECCKRHSGNCAGQELWLPNDGIIDQVAIDSVVHEAAGIRLTWVEAMIVVAVMLAAGHSVNETTRRLGFDSHVYRHGVLRGVLAKEDLARAIAAITHAPAPDLPTPEERRRARKRRAYARHPEIPTPERLAAKATASRERRARLKAAAFGGEAP